jgi:hypothetical protein
VTLVLIPTETSITIVLASLDFTMQELTNAWPVIQAVFLVKTAPLALHVILKNSKHSNQDFVYANKDSLSLSSKIQLEYVKNAPLNAGHVL